MRTRTTASKRDDAEVKTLEAKHLATGNIQEASGERTAFSGPQGKILDMQSKRGNQYVLRMMAKGAFPGSTVQRDDDGSEEDDGSGATNAVDGDLLGLKGVSGKVKQVIDKTQKGVNKGIDWTIDKFRSGAEQFGEWWDS